MYVVLIAGAADADTENTSSDSHLAQHERRRSLVIICIKGAGLTRLTFKFASCCSSGPSTPTKLEGERHHTNYVQRERPANRMATKSVVIHIHSLLPSSPGPLSQREPSKKNGRNIRTDTTRLGPLEPIPPHGAPR